MPPIGKERERAEKRSGKKVEHRETKGKGSINGARSSVDCTHPDSVAAARRVGESSATAWP